MSDIMKPSEVLRAARELISVPERWTQGVNARNGNGFSVSYDDPSANCFCLYGALCRVTGRALVGEAWEIVDHLITSGGVFSSVSIFNDYTTHDDVLSLLDEGIALAEQSEAGAP